LINPSEAPTYKIINPKRNKDSSNQDFSDEFSEDNTCTIKFMAGPPYEDIAFKIVKKEWEYAHNQGFRSVFDKGVLQLHFRFKRYRYRK